ncbi:MAG TPA: hypothetical protein VFL17_20810 [Anaerolineae bacterium]|nr:hypothetical protein [Anaerolineae bacterium]
MSDEYVYRLSRDADTQEHGRASYRRLGLICGAAIGLGLALGAWAPDFVARLDVPMQDNLPGIALGALALALLCALAGRLSARIDRAAIDVLIWLATGAVSYFVIARAPYEVRTGLVGLLDSRFAGLPIYPYDGFGHGRAAFFVMLFFFLLGITHAIRCEALRGSLGPRDRPTTQTRFLLAFHLAAALGVGLIADGAVNAPLRIAPQLVNEAIRTGRTYEGDLFELSRESSLNYNAISGVRDQMSERYTLQVGESDLVESLTVIVVAHFDNGAWINCRVLADQLSFCYDASPPYLEGFRAFLTGESVAGCRGCALRVGEGMTLPPADLSGPLRITREAQWGSYVLMRAESPSGDAVECLLHGISPVTVERCAVVSP